MRPRISLRSALSDPALLGTALAGSSWAAWRSLLIAAMGETLLPDELDHFRRLTGRYAPPPERVEEFWAVIGRRGGKSRAMATLATYLAGLCDHTDALAPGEHAVALVIAPDQRQAAITLEYAHAAFEASPILAQLIEHRTADTLVLSNRVSIEVRSASFRRLRGPTYIAVIADEAAFWHNDESANPDTEILNAVRPGLATTGGPLIVASSPHARRGELWHAHRRHYGPDGDPLVLVVQGESRALNPSLPQSVVDRALERDPASASAEFLAQFRSDIESFVSLESIEACIEPGLRERIRSAGCDYVAFADPSGGSADSFTLGIAHADADGLAVLDCIREIRPPFSPADATADFAGVIQSYGLSSVTGDRFGGEWVREAFRTHSIAYRPAELSKSQIYGELLPLVNARRCTLLDHPRLVAQIAGLERRTARGGRDSIDHAPGARDDVANAAAGALWLASQATRQGEVRTGFFADGGPITWAEKSVSGGLRAGQHQVEARPQSSFVGPF
jgi:hypothetical protein